MDVFVCRCYTKHMKKDRLVRVAIGLVVIALGVILLLQNLGIISKDMWHVYWSALLGLAFIGSGLLAMFGNRRLWIAGVPLIMVGVGFMLKAFHVTNINVWDLFWPIVLIAMGLYSLTYVKRSRKTSESERSEKVAIFYGDNSQVQGAYDGGSLTAIFGGVDLDLKDAAIKDGSVIEVTVFCGGVSITVPDDVIVVNDVRGILGDSDNQATPKTSAKKKLYVRGDCVMGGFEIKTKA